MCMKNIRQYILPALLSCLVFTACEKLPLQPGYDYDKSHYDDKVNMSVMDFMKSRPDLFSGMLEAIDYVDSDPAYKDIKPLYSATGYTYLLLHNNALVNLEDANSYFSKNRFPNPEPGAEPLKGTSWTQYPKKDVADLLKFHILKGRHDYSNLTSKPFWADTYLLGETNDSARIYIYMQATREGYIFFNNFLVFPDAAYKEVRPRTPNLLANNGPIHVMNRYLLLPTKEQYENNK